MKKQTLIEYGFLLIAIAFFLMSSWMLFKYFLEVITTQANFQLLMP